MDFLDSGRKSRWRMDSGCDSLGTSGLVARWCGVTFEYNGKVNQMSAYRFRTSRTPGSGEVRATRNPCERYRVYGKVQPMDEDVGLIGRLLSRLF